MSRILVVEPFRMLQQGLVFALASEHEIQVTDKIPPSNPVPEADLAIIDAATLANDSDLAPLLAAVSSWQIPVVCLGGELPAAGAPEERFIRLALPVDREMLRKALVDLLAPGQAPHSVAGPAAPGEAKRKKTAASPVVGENQHAVIELVEIVEEEPAGRPRQTDTEKEN